jgi:hypothetical protein
MTKANVFRVKNRLAEVMKRPGGRSLAELAHGADRRVAAIREDCLKSLGGQIERMRARASEGRDGADPTALDDIYAAANEIFAVAAVFELKHLSEAAYEFCDLADHFRETGAPIWPAIEVYVDGLNLLLTGSSETVAASVVLTGLRRVRARFIRETAQTGC